MNKAEAIARAKIFFGGKVCVHTEDDTAVDWHHLDCDENNNTPFNLVPLTSTIHQAYHRDPARRGSCGCSLIEIAGRSWETFDRGLHPRAYGALRFCAFASQNDDADFSLRCAVGSLCSLRPLYRVDYAIDTLERSAIPTIERASPWVRALLAMEISLWLRDTGDPEGAKRWFEVSSYLQQRPDYPSSQQRLDVARARIHRSISLIMQANVEGVGLLNEVREMKRDYRAAGMNTALWEAMYHLWNRDPHLFCDIVEESLQQSVSTPEGADALRIGVRLPGTTWWTFVEMLLANADAAHLRGDEEEREKLAGIAYRVFMAGRIVPAGNLSRASLDWYQDKHRLVASERVPSRSLSELDAMRPIFNRIWDIVKPK